MSAARLKSAWWTQVTAQVMTLWVVALTLTRLQGTDALTLIFVLSFYVLAVVLPLRGNGSIRDRAISSMAAAAVMASAMSFQMVGIILNLRLGLANLFTLLAMVLFSVAGSLYWLSREGDSAGLGG
jgi:hypothetical protein